MLLWESEFGELDAVVRVAAVQTGKEREGLGGGGLGVGEMSQRLVGDGGEAADLCGDEEVQPSWRGFDGVDPVMCGLGGEQGASCGHVVADAGVAGGGAGLKQCGVAGVVAGFAAGEGGSAGAQGFAKVEVGGGDGQEGFARLWR